MDLLAHTLSALDWPAVLAALSRHARTQAGARAALRPDFAPDPAAVAARYAAVTEVTELEAFGERLPVGAVTDVIDLLDRAGRGITLDAPELTAVSSCLQALKHLRTWLEEREEPLDELRRLALPIEVDPELHDVLRRSFGADGELSEREYPELGELRRKAESLRNRIKSTLDDIIKGDGMGDALRDRYVTQRDGRFVIPVKAERRKGLGIVHGRSQSGETVFVEPAAVVELHNELSEAETALHREISRILGVLTRMVGRFREPLGRSLAAAERIDLAVARAGLGKELTGVVPKVGSQGVIDLVAARHPVLAIRGLDVVPNDLRVDGNTPGLVLSGPNTGGKTIALKTLGLAALMVRAGLPLPAAEGSRADFFDPIVADVGDWQSVEGDLSTFSGHVAVLKAVLAAAALDTGGPPPLVLLDEVGMGTDPAQGAALARAVLEALVDAGARVGVTTHYTELKALAAVDPRFAVAAVAIEDGRPTYQVLRGATGESHALAIASGLALPAAVVQRARALLTTTQREVSDLVGKLEDERAQLARQVRDQASTQADLQERLLALQQREDKLEQRRAELERTVSERFQARLKAREDELKQLIAALQEDPDLRLAGRALSRVREVMDEARVPEPTVAVGPPPKALKKGDTVVVRSLGRKAKVTRLLKGGQVEVQAGIMKMKVAVNDLEGTRGETVSAPDKNKPKPLVRERKIKEAPARTLGKLRVERNTCDLRGQRVEDALERVEHFLSDLRAQGFDIGWILHGHGTGALKQAVRRHLPAQTEVVRWRPADSGEGGDAFTVVELR